MTDATAYGFTGAKSHNENKLVQVCRAQVLQRLQSDMDCVTGGQDGHRDGFFPVLVKLTQHFCIFLLFPFGGKISSLPGG